MDEGTLIRRASSGDRHAFGILVQAHQEGVFHWIRALVSDEEAARDLTQETFLRGFRGLSGFRGDAAFGTWLRTIALNVTRTHMRAEGDGRFVPLEPDLASTVPSPDAGVLAEGTRRALSAALAQLPERQREVVLLRMYEELPYSEIARRVGSSENAAKVNFHHAIKRLRRIMRAASEVDPSRRGS